MYALLSNCLLILIPELCKLQEAVWMFQGSGGVPNSQVTGKRTSPVSLRSPEADRYAQLVHLKLIRYFFVGLRGFEYFDPNYVKDLSMPA